MSWKSESEDRLARAVAQAEVEGMNIDSVRAQAAATLALVEVTERLAVAQETANLIAFLKASERHFLLEKHDAKLIRERLSSYEGTSERPASWRPGDAL